MLDVPHPLDDRDTFRKTSYTECLLQEAKDLISLWSERRHKGMRWDQVVRHFMVKYDEEITEGINASLGRENVPR